MNTLGTLVRLTTFGESHGPAMGGILEGIPPLLYIDMSFIQSELARRKPGKEKGTGVSKRNESDEIEILSGISPEGVTLGTPIGFIIRNRDARSGDYSEMAHKFRPNHADYTYYKKYGIHDFRGGGRSSARETVSWVAAGAICKIWLREKGINIEAQFLPTNDVDTIAAQGDSTGGIVKCTVTGVPLGIGEPVFDKLHARLAHAMMSINAAKGFEYGDGFKSAWKKGSEVADIFLSQAEREQAGIIGPCSTNHSGGIQGGISNGMPVEFAVYFKPTPTIFRPQDTVDIEGRKCAILPKGRHDACVAIRAVPVVEAMAALVIADMMKISC